MSIAIDTNVLVRLLVRDDEAQYALARRGLSTQAPTSPTACSRRAPRTSGAAAS